MIVIGLQISSGTSAAYASKQERIEQIDKVGENLNRDPIGIMIEFIGCRSKEVSRWTARERLGDDERPTERGRQSGRSGGDELGDELVRL